MGSSTAVHGISNRRILPERVVMSATIILNAFCPRSSLGELKCGNAICLNITTLEVGILSSCHTLSHPIMRVDILTYLVETCVTLRDLVGPYGTLWTPFSKLGTYLFQYLSIPDDIIFQ